jgi:hypothetical protein
LPRKTGGFQNERKFKMCKRKVQEILEENIYPTFLLRNTSARNQEIPYHLSCFVLKGNQEILTQIHLSRLPDLLRNSVQLIDLKFKVKFNVSGFQEFTLFTICVFPVSFGPWVLSFNVQILMI